MAFTEYKFGPYLYQHFVYYAAGSAVTSYINETATISGPFRLAEVRLHLSTVMGSNKYFAVRVSSVVGSSYDATLLSQNLNGLQDVLLVMSEPFLLMSGDKVWCISSQISVANEYGLQLVGWAAIAPA